MLLAWRRAPLPAATPAPAVAEAPLPRPERLPPSPEFARTASPANVNRSQRPAPVPVTLHVRNLAADWWSERAGLSVQPIDASEAPVWLPLPAAPAASGDVLIAHTLAAAGDFVVTVAASHELALHGYLARTTVKVGAAPEPISVDVDASAARVSIALPPAATATHLLRLTRDGDPHWLPAAFASTGLSLAPGAPVHVWLGAGGYELRDPLQPERRQPFEVPRDREVVVSATLTRARADRP